MNIFENTNRLFQHQQFTTVYFSHLPEISPVAHLGLARHEKIPYCMCEKEILKLSCASAQSDLHTPSMNPGESKKRNIKTLVSSAAANSFPLIVTPY